MTITAYAALVISLPVILYQAYAFILPALTDREKRVVVPFLWECPFCSSPASSSATSSSCPLPPSSSSTSTKASSTSRSGRKDYYSFFTLTLAVMGLIFQLPIGILAVTRLGIVTPEQLSQNRRYAYVILIIVAALLPGTDPVTMLIEAVPLLLLYEGSVILARMFGRPPEPASDRDISLSEPPPSGAA